MQCIISLSTISCSPVFKEIAKKANNKMAEILEVEVKEENDFDFDEEGERK